jgi:hypothetical protein
MVSWPPDVRRYRTDFTALTLIMPNRSCWAASERDVRPYLENFLYFSRWGMTESVPRRRILSVS